MQAIRIASLLTFVWQDNKEKKKGIMIKRSNLRFIAFILEQLGGKAKIKKSHPPFTENGFQAYKSNIYLW